MGSVRIQKCPFPLLVIIFKHGFPISEWAFLFQASLCSGGSRELVPPRPCQYNIMQNNRLVPSLGNPAPLTVEV